MTSTESKGTSDIFAAALRKNKKAFRKKKVVVVPLLEPWSLKQALSDSFKFKETKSLQTIGELAVSRSMLGGPESAVFIVEVPKQATKDDVTTILREAAYLKSGGGKALDVFIYVCNAAQVPYDLPAGARLDEATRKARDDALAAVNVASKQGPMPFFLALLELAPMFQRSNLAVVEGLLKEDDADAIERASEILANYTSSARDAAAAQREAFLDFGYYGVVRGPSEAHLIDDILLL